MVSGELPLERLSEALVMTFELLQAPGESRQGGKVIGSKDLALDDGEIDFDLIEPAGVDRSMNQAQVGITLLQALNGSRAAVTGAVVNNPKDPTGMAVGVLIHDLLDQAVEGGNGASGFATAVDPGLVDIPGGQIGPGSEAPVLMLDLEGRVGPGRQRGMATLAGLDGGLLIGAHDELIRVEGLTLPNALVEIKQAAGLGEKVRIAGKQPATMLPGPDGILMEPAPDGRPADGSYQSRLTDLSGQIVVAPAREGNALAGRQLAGQGLNLNNDLWGEKLGGGPSD